MASRTLHHLRKLLSFLPKRRLVGLGVLLFLSIVVGLFDIVFVGLLARLIGAISGSKLADNIPGIHFFGGGFQDQLPWIVSLLIVLIWLSSGLKYVMLLLQSRLASQVWCDFGDQLYRNIIYQPYEYFQGVTSAAIIGRLNRIINRISDDIVLPLILVVSNLTTVTVIAVGVFVVLGWKAILVFVSLILAYAIVSALLVPWLRLASKQRIRFAQRVNSVLIESIRSIRDVNLYAAEPQFIERFHAVGLDGKRFDRLEKRLVDVPRYVIEPAGITILFAVGLLPSLLSGDLDGLRQAVPILAAIMFALLKLSAPIQAIFRALNKFRGSLPEIEDALELLRMKPVRLLRQAQGSTGVSGDGLMPKRTIQFESLWFKYQQSTDWVLRGISLSIPIGSRIALVGPTGGGKTTLAHLLLGLYTPQQGSLCLDGIPLLDEEVAAWQSCCAMVPQDIVLLDSSVRANVAFGVDEDAVDDERVWEALSAAQLDEFVADLPYGLYTVIGENGVRLSGGQRQRLSLARAFYKKAKLLVLDEATSALDNKTESDVLEALELIGRRCTTVVIAHRLSTVKNCDRIFELESGRVKAYGTFDELQQRSESFRELVKFDHV